MDVESGVSFGRDRLLGFMRVFGYSGGAIKWLGEQ